MTTKTKKSIDLAIQKYGRENFDLFTVEAVDTQDQANCSEIFWIAEKFEVHRQTIGDIKDGKTWKNVG